MDTVPIDVCQHVAVTAWNKLQQNRAEPTSIQVIEETTKSAIYKLKGLGDGGAAVIAKRCRTANAHIEHTIYKNILPQLSISHPHFYGMVIENGGQYSWLFFEFSDGEQYSRFVDRHRILGARWLGHMHTRSTRVFGAASLPDRGTKYHLNRLRSARNSLFRRLSNSCLPSDDFKVLQRAVVQCNFLESRWNEVERVCDQMPSTLVHGDFVEENVRISMDGFGTTVRVFDWEKAGWGVPAVDLAHMDIREYHSAVSGFWPQFKFQDWEQLQRIGMIFRTLVHNWANKRIKKINQYQARLADQIRTAGLGNCGI